jgi:hypothetical protein
MVKIVVNSLSSMDEKEKIKKQFNSLMNQTNPLYFYRLVLANKTSI